MNRTQILEAVEKREVQIGSRIYPLTKEVEVNRCDGCYFGKTECPTIAIDICTVGHVVLGSPLTKKHK